jgi:hypothetical protein
LQNEAEAAKALVEMMLESETEYQTAIRHRAHTQNYERLKK